MLEKTQNVLEAIADHRLFKEYDIRFVGGVKVEFFVPPFNLFEKEIWTDEPTTQYRETHVKVASFKTIIYMKSMAFWNRKKYRDLFDIHYAITHITGYDAKTFVESYLKYNITYTKEMLYTKLKSKTEFYEKHDDEGISSLVTNAKSYEWYRSQIEDSVYDVYIEALYTSF